MIWYCVGAPKCVWPSSLHSVSITCKKQFTIKTNRHLVDFYQSAHMIINLNQKWIRTSGSSDSKHLIRMWTAGDSF